MIPIISSLNYKHKPYSYPKFGGRGRQTQKIIIKYQQSYLQWLSQEYPERIIDYYNNLRQNKFSCFCKNGLGNVTCENCEYQDQEPEDRSICPSPEPEPDDRGRQTRSIAPSPEPEPEQETSYHYQYRYEEHEDENGEYWFEEYEEWS